ncbi:sec7 domain-containing protein [Ditylenchus destructor]|nr:sec7 domain-containing protein [Ditylenchus destructor]
MAACSNWGCAVFRCFISLVDPFDPMNNNSTIHTGLNLITVAMETGAGSHLNDCNLLLPLIKNNLSWSLLQLMGSDKAQVFEEVNRAFFLLFQSMRKHLKFQMESYILQMVTLIVSEENDKKQHEFKMIALESLLNFICSIPGLPTELYINYDCGLYCSDILEELTQSLRNLFLIPQAPEVYPEHVLAFDALTAILDVIEENCQSTNVPHACLTIEDASQQTTEKNPRNKKQLMVKATEYFNVNPDEGIGFLSANGLFGSDTSAMDIVRWLRQNPHLSKNKLANFLCNRRNSAVLKEFIRSFDMTNTRPDEALRILVGAFHLPGESAEISKILQHLSEYWFECNDGIVHTADAAFTLLYAIILLNVDQHNPQVARTQPCMTLEAFKRNLAKTNNGEDFDQQMLDAIYCSIKNDELICPAEQEGLVRDLHYWNELLFRGEFEEGIYIFPEPSQLNGIGMFEITSVAILTAIYYILDKSMDEGLLMKALDAFCKCASIAARYEMGDVLESLLTELCKFNSLALVLNEYSLYTSLKSMFVNISSSQLAVKVRVHAVQKISKILLLHLSSLGKLECFTRLIDKLLNFMEIQFKSHKTLEEVVTESVKNMVLVLESQGLLIAKPELRRLICERLNSFLPKLVGEVLPSNPLSYLKFQLL